VECKQDIPNQARARLMHRLVFIGVFLLRSFILPGQTDRSGEVLIYTKNGKGYVHDNRLAAIRALTKILTGLSLQVTATEDPSVFNQKELSRFRLIIFASTNNDVFDNNDQRLTFRHYIESGGKFLGIHSAVGTERNWSWFKQMIGGTFLNHPPYQTYTILNVAPGHTSVKNIPAKWKKSDECYFLKERSKKIIPLLMHDLNTLDKPDEYRKLGKTTEDLYPAVWTHRFDGGQIWITALGHDSSDYKDNMFIRHLRDGIRYLVDEPFTPDSGKAYALNFDDPVNKK
jgi:type 1 glutamine amidotransferase